MVREEGGTVLLAVADGVGGAAGGEIAADAAIVALAERFYQDAPGLPIEERLTEAIREANTAVLRAAEASGNHSAASTLVAAAVRRDHLVVANLGDSRAYLIRDGASRQLTEDHSGDLQHAITRFVGDPRGVHPDVFVEDLRPSDLLVLCSDGLTRHVAPEEIAATVIANDSERAADTLVALANARGGEDNVTVVLHAARTARLARPSRRALAFGIFVALVLVAVIGAVAVLFSLGPYAR